MRVLVCGGRNYNDYDELSFVLEDIACEYSQEYKADENWLPTDITIITGGATGADTLANKWAVTNWTQYKEYKADWNQYGKAAGAIRNQQMIDEGKPDLVIAFPGGKGTKDMISRAKKAGIEVIEIKQGAGFLK